MLLKELLPLIYKESWVYIGEKISEPNNRTIYYDLFCGKLENYCPTQRALESKINYLGTCEVSEVSYITIPAIIIEIELSL